MTAKDLLALSMAEDTPTKETNSQIIANQLRELSKLTKNPTLAKKIRDLANQAAKF